MVACNLRALCGASVAAPAKMLETWMEETPHIFWINVCHKKKSIYRYYVCLHRSTLLYMSVIVSSYVIHVVKSK